jgi:hypothetical protein
LGVRGLGLPFPTSSKYKFQHPFQLIINLGIPESKNDPAFRLKIFCAFRITFFATEMSFPVQFENDSTFMTSKVGEKPTDSMLAAKFIAGKTAISQYLPQDALGRGSMSSELPCCFSSIRVVRHDCFHSQHRLSR